MQINMRPGPLHLRPLLRHGASSQSRETQQRAPYGGRPGAEELKFKPMATTFSGCHMLVTVMVQLGFVLVLALLDILAYPKTGFLCALAIFASVLLGTFFAIRVVGIM